MLHDFKENAIIQISIEKQFAKYVLINFFSNCYFKLHNGSCLI